MYETIKNQARQATEELLEVANLERGDIFVVGCSSSEIAGGVIGHDSSLNMAEAAFEGIYPVLNKKGIYLACQCCEHLNRAIIIEREAAKNTATKSCLLCLSQKRVVLLPQLLIRTLKTPLHWKM